jgi:hypothetical protein
LAGLAVQHHPGIGMAGRGRMAYTLTMRMLSVNRQEFSGIIQDDCIYVDKTEHIHRLIQSGKAFFLARPRRFGKSLLVNTLKELFAGRRELFKDTWIHDRIQWRQHPIIKIDFSSMDYRNQGLEGALKYYLDELSARMSIPALGGDTSKLKFQELIQQLCARSGPVVILVDEYDKPIIDYIEQYEQAEANREILKNFYSCLKSLDNDIRFLFITGVSKFSKVSIFSDLNHLLDISINPRFSALVGFTLDEVRHSFDDYLKEVEDELGYARTDLIERMQRKYNGYSWDGRTFVYNPFSIQNFLLERRFRNYWFATGTATFLVKAIRAQGKAPESVSPLEVGEAFFDKFELRSLDVSSLLFQTGYLTIKHCDPQRGRYTLAYPNEEVEESFLNNMLELWSAKVPSETGSILIALEDSLEYGNPQAFVEAFQRLFSGIPYDDLINEKALEGLFRSNVYLALKIIGVRIAVEVHTSRGRIDAVIEGRDSVFVVEFKMGSAREAMAQIHDNQYARPYAGGSKKLYLLGLGFDADKRTISDYLVEEG